jgi:hypothetical protein
LVAIHEYVRAEGSTTEGEAARGRETQERQQRGGQQSREENLEVSEGRAA